MHIPTAQVMYLLQRREVEVVMVVYFEDSAGLRGGGSGTRTH